MNENEKSSPEQLPLQEIREIPKWTLAWNRESIHYEKYD